MSNETDFVKRWIRFGIICGILAGTIYGLSVSGLIPDAYAYLLFLFFGPLLCASSGGLYYFIKHHQNSIPLQVGTLFLIISGALVTLMASMQGALKVVFQNIPLDSISESGQAAREMALRSGDSLQLGADIAWDMFIFMSVFFLSIAALKHPRLGWVFGLPGILIGLVGLGFNLYTFPHNPGTAGLIDTGPLVGLWFVAVSVRVIFSLKWIEH
jgi:hypothetical protein